MQDYIESHLSEPITLHQLAGAAGYSPWHAERIFKSLTGKAPFDYIRDYRLTQAAKALWNQDNRVVDVAFDYVFDSHEGFTKAFSRKFGMAPRRYSRETPAVPFFLPNRVIRRPATEKERVKMSTMNTVFVQVIERPTRKILLLRAKTAEDYFAFCDEVGCEVWGVLSSVKEALYEPIGMWLPSGMIPAGTSKYVQGVELPMDYDKAAPEGYEIIEVPACKMMVFQGPPFKDEDFESAITDVWELMKSYDPKIYGYEWADDDAPRFQLSPVGYRGYIEARPVRTVSKG
jgi:AraC-like DNA-binding protein